MDDLKKAVDDATAALAAKPDDAKLKDALAKAQKALAVANAPAKVDVRILAARDGHAADSVVSLSAAEAESAVANGWADADPAAVAFAREEAVRLAR